MDKIIVFIIIALLLYMRSGAKDSCLEYSHFTCKEIKEAEYNVFFYYPNGFEVQIGQTKGLNNCNAIAVDYARHNKVEDENENEQWSYICCMIANGSSCYEKHR